ncbi:hypothetical protein EXS73_01365 [Candidatus Pacearchaeota archaeon]|nr:hypothetical protein [Candidatus Pacearchaeota archaeon]
MGKEREVEQCEGWVQGNECMLWTRGLANCIGLGLYFPHLKIGWLIHTPMIEHEALEAMLTTAQTYGTRKQLQAIVTGGSYDPKLQDQTIDQATKKSRSYLGKILKKKLPQKATHIDWGTDDGLTTLYLDLITGTYKIEHTNYAEE